MPKILILSGEGYQGTFVPYTGQGTPLALLRRYRKEKAGGDRWCKIFIFSPKDGCYAIYHPEMGGYTGELRHVPPLVFSRHYDGKKVFSHR